MNINYQSDFKIVERLMPDAPFRFTYYIGKDKGSVTAEYDGQSYSGCLVEGERLIVPVDGGTLGIGNVRVKREYFLDDKAFSDGVCNLVSVECTDIELGRGRTDSDIEADVEVGVPYKTFTFEDMTEDQKQEIADRVPTKEAEREEAEAQRVEAEKGRAAAEAARQTAFDTNEEARQVTFNTNESKREAEFGAVIQNAKNNLIVVNDLTTGGADKALSAEMGKELKGTIDTEIRKTYEYSDKLNSIIGNGGDITVGSPSDFIGLLFNGATFIESNDNYNGCIIPIIKDSIIKQIIGIPRGVTYFAIPSIPYDNYIPDKREQIHSFPYTVKEGFNYLFCQFHFPTTGEQTITLNISDTGFAKEIKSNSENVSNLIKYEKSVQWESGFILPKNGQLPITPQDNMVHSLLDCSEGQEYIISFLRATTAVFAWQFLDNDNNILSKHASADYLSNITITAPKNATKVLFNSYTYPEYPKVNYWNNNKPEALLRKEIEEEKSNINGIYQQIAELESTLQKINPLSGKTILCLGDSITEFNYEGKRYSDYIAEKTGASVINGGIGGTQMSRRADVPTSGVFSANYEAYACLDLPSIAESLNSGDFTLQMAACNWLISDSNPNKQNDDNREIVNRLSSVDLSKVDIITIFIGTNDIGRPLGTLGDTGEPYKEMNISAGFNAIIKNLLSKNPNLRIYYFSPMPRYFGDVRQQIDESLWCDNYSVNNIPFKNMVDHQIELAKYYKIPVCDMYRTLGINQWNILSVMRGDISDGTHPYRGFKMIANKIISFIQSNNNLND